LVKGKPGSLFFMSKAIFLRRYLIRFLVKVGPDYKDGTFSCRAISKVAAVRIFRKDWPARICKIVSCVRMIK
jgi:hypothetical protein